MNATRAAPFALRAAAFALLAAAFTPTSDALALDVVSHSPAPYALAVPPDATITVTFDAALDPATVNSASVRVRGLTSGTRAAVLSVNGAVLGIDPIGSFPPGEIVTINLTSALRDQAASNLAGGHSFQFTIRVGGGMLSFQEIGRWSTAPAQTPYFVFGGDLDGNGTPDAAVPNEDTNDLSVFLNGGDGVLDQHLEYATGIVPSSCFGDDFDHDGDLDVATANISSSNMTVLLNDGTGGFSSMNLLSGVTCRQVYGGDFDGDGDTDLVTTGFSDNTLNLHFNQGNGTFGPRSPIPVSAGPFPVFVADMNLDGLLDIIAGFQGTPRQVQIFANQGGGVFAAGPTLAVGGGAWDFFGNDLDGDGDLDLALVEANTSRVRILYGNGAGGFASTLTFSTGSFPLAVFTADLDGDGDHEVISSDFSGADIRVFENAGGGLFPFAQSLPTLQSGSYAWAHDLDGDGDLDLTVVDELADRIFTFRNPAEPTGLPPGGEETPPLALRLLRPFPNPAATRATIGFEAPPAAGPLTLRIVDAAGRLVRTLVSGPPPRSGRGQAAWDTRAAHGAPVPAGVYFIELEAAGKRAAGRLEVVR